MRNIIGLIALILWLLLGWKMCTDYDTCCGDKTETSAVAEHTAAPVAAATTTAKDCDGYVCFGRNSYDPTYSSSFSRLKDSLANLVGDDGRLVIVGKYGVSETNNSTYDNLGLARAASVRTRFADALHSDRIDLKSQRTVGKAGGSGDFIEFELVDGAQADVDADAGTASVERSTLIYFPFNSTNKLDDGDVEGLPQLCSRASHKNW